jgi:cation diffusion facilitator CzcD-associated flavoprotein CzcO
MTKTSIDTTAIIIGAGITGIGAAYTSRADPYVARGEHDVGGVWHTQRWHGARCDWTSSSTASASSPFSPHACRTAPRSSATALGHRGVRIVDHIHFDTVTAASSTAARSAAVRQAAPSPRSSCQRQRFSPAARAEVSRRDEFAAS